MCSVLSPFLLKVALATNSNPMSSGNLLVAARVDSRTSIPNPSPIITAMREPEAPSKKAI
eukprot:CAMPEP_0201938336 /NCGR_PEP_ID=MMETSP0903-20130614/41219_1 /ASSEMBLY_ACC=CAM_ASM_000552 /TAXON_ID=420261 /ORGANISM="Thalassiosira antarctica, Strain CCMP982" /LENGTH=59 /DNA_ID=CAMNT_0048479581 /DNA_START=139 /DNA_END=318 /DNA_ORIENTATION=+